MQGLGNDFVVINNIEGGVCLSTDEIRQLADRRLGIGFDQLLMVENSSLEGVDFRYVIYNADGSEVGQCGNGARCFARFVEKNNLTQKNIITVETISGKIELTINHDNTVRVDMGSPVFGLKDIPFIFEKADMEYLVEGQKMGVLSIGNPHAIINTEDINSNDIQSIGTKIQGSDCFPNGVNVGFMQILNNSEIYLRVIERGVGETLACGSGACAAVVHGVRLGLLDEKVKVHLTGGDALVEFDGNSAYLTGPAEFVYEGSVNMRTGKI
tara:strand:+ start:1954 stop:2760 length:807 start_codon:yes stop_codon:yes gene_type:complete